MHCAEAALAAGQAAADTSPRGCHEGVERVEAHTAGHAHLAHGSRSEAYDEEMYMRSSLTTLTAICMLEPHHPIAINIKF